jgi:hypothetical protein
MSCLISPPAPRPFIPELPEAFSLGFLVSKLPGAEKLISAGNGKPGELPVMRMGPWGAAALFVTAASAVWERVNSSDGSGAALPQPAVAAPAVSSAISLPESPTGASASAVDLMNLLMEAGMRTHHLVAVIRSMLNEIDLRLSKIENQMIKDGSFRKKMSELNGLKKELRKLRVVERGVAAILNVILRCLGIDAIRELYTMSTVERTVARIIELVQEKRFALPLEREFLNLPSYANSTELDGWLSLLERVHEYAKDPEGQKAIRPLKPAWVSVNIHDALERLRTRLFAAQAAAEPTEPEFLDTELEAAYATARNDAAKKRRKGLETPKERQRLYFGRGRTTQ